MIQLGPTGKWIRSEGTHFRAGFEIRWTVTIFLAGTASVEAAGPSGSMGVCRMVNVNSATLAGAEPSDSREREKTGGEGTRRDFLLLAATAVGAVGAGLAAWPFISSMRPAADTLAEATLEVDLSPIETGQAITVVWRKKPVFIRHRTADEIQKAESQNVAELRDPQPDSERVKKPEWLVMIGICTHLGCIPLGQQPNDPTGNYGGWFCPCHGSHYDESGRIRQGPAPRNLAIPQYEFIDDTTIRLG